MNDAAKSATKQWAAEFIERHGAVRDTNHLHELIDRERKDGDALRRCMTLLPVDLFAAAVVHHTSKQVAQQKVRELAIIASERITRREYWNKLDRVHHYVAGVLGAFAATALSGAFPQAVGGN